jgi:hypothetical protein
VQKTALLRLCAHVLPEQAEKPAWRAANATNAVYLGGKLHYNRPNDSSTFVE